jgi:four helix bundle protein
LPKTFTGTHLAGQLTGSGIAPALQYGETQAAEARSDFIHKMKLAAKEPRETYNCLKPITKKLVKKSTAWTDSIGMQ